MLNKKHIKIDLKLTEDTLNYLSQKIDGLLSILKKG
jgi:hypothetical protein